MTLTTPRDVGLVDAEGPRVVEEPVDAEAHEDELS